MSLTYCCCQSSEAEASRCDHKIFTFNHFQKASSLTFDLDQLRHSSLLSSQASLRLAVAACSTSVSRDLWGDWYKAQLFRRKEWDVSGNSPTYFRSELRVSPGEPTQPSFRTHLLLRDRKHRVMSSIRRAGSPLAIVQEKGDVSPAHLPSWAAGSLGPRSHCPLGLTEKGVSPCQELVCGS